VASKGPGILDVATSPASLASESPLRRQPRAPRRRRPEGFWQAFEDRVLFYDAFFHGDGRALLVGPPPHNLRPEFEAASYRAMPFGTALDAAFFASRSTMITELTGVPPGTTGLEIALGGEIYQLPLQPDLTETFAGSRLLFTINKNNRLDWIRAWADWHARMHGTDAVVLFDNGSTDYTRADIEAALAAVPRLETIAVVSLDHRFGPIDPKVLMYTFWPRFLQISSVSLLLRRFGMKAEGLIHTDIDELVHAEGASAYDLARRSDLGVLRMRGQWMEAAHDPEIVPRHHFDFAYRLNDVRARLSPAKWVLDPSRDWVRALDVHPYLHRIHGAPRGARRYSTEAMFFHFKGINTNWKQDRTTSTAIDPRHHVIDPVWRDARGRYAELGGGTSETG